MFVAAYQEPNSHALRELVADERRACGWSYLSNMDGERRDAHSTSSPHSLTGTVGPVSNEQRRTGDRLFTANRSSQRDQSGAKYKMAERPAEAARIGARKTSDEVEDRDMISA